MSSPLPLTFYYWWDILSNYGEQTEVHNGIEAEINARFGDGGIFSGGVSTGRLVADNCDIVLNRPDVTATSTIHRNSSPNVEH